MYSFNVLLMYSSTDVPFRHEFRHERSGVLEEVPLKPELRYTIQQ